ncbi:competence/damage-inducible protein cinA [Pedobacter suwonensis]|uniref:Competence/damage-inducible protein cinA n=1 Tax=Pedobacter suwonensis TaxID=332999 RepID=A0A1I0TLB0_9SPHI|nr:CinA family protein [Pedobacter suwonensis]SFA52571.1 competence/damage-inducible protein cinA [Pedobacter suwonensis]
MKSNKMDAVGKMLIGKKLTIAFAESATAGRLSAEFSMIDHAGEFLKGGIACYDAQLKQDLLQVDHTLIKTYTPESMEVTRAISLGLSRLIPADIHIGITGLTAPGGSETEEKPVGTVFIYATSKGGLVFSERLNFTGEREEIVSATVEACADLLIDYLSAID